MSRIMSTTKHFGLRMGLYQRLGVGIALAFAIVLVPMAAQAQRRSPLADAPAIRKRLELRSTRLEAGVGMASTLNQDFFHTVMAEVKLGFHFSDWISLSGVGGFAVANLATGFQDRLVAPSGGLLPDNPPVMREPTRDEALASMTKIKQMLALQLEITPFAGKYSMFGKLFAHYDFYLFVGGGGLNVGPAGPGMPQDCGAVQASGSPGPFSCAVTGFKPGGTFGVGLHSFFNQFVALNVELRDMIAKLNPAGRDVNGDQVADAADLTWSHTYVVGANLVIYLPTVADISP